MTLLYTTFCFEASHSLALPLGMPQLHGHSYWARVWVRSEAEGVTPLPELEREAMVMRGLLDHQHLNDVLKTAPTMEALTVFIRAHWKGPALQRVCVWRESLGCGAEWVADH